LIQARDNAIEKLGASIRWQLKDFICKGFNWTSHVSDSHASSKKRRLPQLAPPAAMCVFDAERGRTL